jgi:hypothetical protein
METDSLELKPLEEKVKNCILNLDVVNHLTIQNNNFEDIKHLAILAKFENEKFVKSNNFMAANKWANYAVILYTFLSKKIPEIDWYPDILLIKMRTIQNFQDSIGIQKVANLIDEFIQKLPYGLDDVLQKIAVWKTLHSSEIVQLRRIKNALRIFSVFLNEDQLENIKYGNILLSWLKIRSQLP